MRALPLRFEDAISTRSIGANGNTGSQSALAKFLEVANKTVMGKMSLG